MVHSRSPDVSQVVYRPLYFIGSRPFDTLYAASQPYTLNPRLPGLGLDCDEGRHRSRQILKPDYT